MSTMRRLVPVVAAGLLAASCIEEKPGTVAFYNDSGQTVLLLEDPYDSASLEVAVDFDSYDPHSHQIAAGGRSSFSIGNSGSSDDGPWCPRATYFVVRSISGRTYLAGRERDQNPPLEASDLEILEQRGPGYCFDGKHSEWHFEG